MHLTLLLLLLPSLLLLAWLFVQPLVAQSPLYIHTTAVMLIVWVASYNIVLFFKCYSDTLTCMRRYVVVRLYSLLKRIFYKRISDRL